MVRWDTSRPARWEREVGARISKLLWGPWLDESKKEPIGSLLRTVDFKEHHVNTKCISCMQWTFDKDNLLFTGRRTSCAECWLQIKILRNVCSMFIDLALTGMWHPKEIFKRFWSDKADERWSEQKQQISVKKIQLTLMPVSQNVCCTDDD